MHDANLCNLFDAWIIFMNEIMPKSMFEFCMFWNSKCCICAWRDVPICLFWMHVHCTMIIVDQGSRGMIFLYSKKMQEY